MRPAKDQKIHAPVRKKVEVEIDEQLIVQLHQMESYTKITATELLETALKRFIAGHKDYFPG